MATCSGQCVRVFVRVRPTPNFASDSITINDKSVSIHLPVSPRRLSQQIREWNFLVDGVLNNSSQEEVYTRCAQSVVSNVMEGFNGTIFAYGQTGAGKTYTMSGEPQYKFRGVIPHVLSQIFKTVRERDDCTIIVRISCLEIYNETLTDLLEITPKKSLSVSEMNEKGTVVKGLSVRVAENEEEALNLFFEAERNRLVGERTLNKQCSRSHVVFTIVVECHSSVSASSEFTASKLNLVDLAGSERLDLNEYTGAEVTEAIYINKSLSFLEQVVIALAEKRRAHIPYRHCKLTQVLKGCLGGNCNTVMIANVWGERHHLGNTLATLRFAERIMGVSTDPQLNTHYNPVGLIRKYERDIKALKEEMAMQDLLYGKSSGKTTGNSLTEAQVKAIKDQVKEYITGNSTSLEFNSVREIKEIFGQFKQYISTLERDHREEIGKMQEVMSKVEPSTSSAGADDSKSSKTSKGKLNFRKSMGISPSVVVEEEEEEDHSDKKYEVAVSDGQTISIEQAPSELISPKLPIGKKRTSFLLPKTTVAIDAKKKSSNKVLAGGGGGDTDIGIDDEKTLRPSSPPTRAEAFEEFKKSRGKEINIIFLQNKDLLRRKRKAAFDTSFKVNQLKQKIDELRKRLEEKKRSRTHQITTTDGRLVIDREEYNHLKELQQAKADYKTQYTIFEGLQLEVPFCEEYTQKSRQKLVDEFDIWYKAVFLVDKSKLDEATATKDRSHQDEASSTVIENNRFKSLQQSILLQGNISTLAFYSAQRNIEKREINERRMSNIKKSIILSH